MKSPAPHLVPLRPLPTAIVAVTAITASTVTAVASLTGTSTPAAWAVLAATAATVAAIATLVWPRLATDVLGLHGTVFPSPADGGDLPLLGRLRQILAASADHALAHRFMAWQRHVGFGVNFQFYVFGSRTVVLVDPADVRAVSVRVDPPRDRQMLRHFGTPISADMLFLISDPHHAAVRRLTHPFLSGVPTADTVLRVVNAELGRSVEAGTGAAATGAAAAGAAAEPSWADRLDALAAAGTAVDLDELMTEFTLCVMHQLLFSSSLSAEEATATAKRMHQLIMHITALSGLPMPNVLSPNMMAAVRATGNRFVAYAAEMEARRRAAYAAGTAASTTPRDMLDILLADLDQPGGAYGGDRRRVAADLLFYLMAGYDTTAHSIAWTIHLLCDNPEVEARLLAELESALPPPGTPLTSAHLAALPYTDAVWKESLRLFPPAPLGSVRRLAADLRLPSDGSIIPAGTSVHMPVLPVHRNGAAYPSPDKFDPSRWLPPTAPGGGGHSAADQRTARAHFMVFSWGPRSCPGQNMAAVEAKAVLATLLRRFRLERVGKSADVVLDNSVTLRPAGFRVTLHRREAA